MAACALESEDLPNAFVASPCSRGARKAGDMKSFWMVLGLGSVLSGLVPTAAHQARFTIQANAMLDALEGKPCPLATLEDARTNLMVALAAKRSWQERRIIAIGE